MLIQYRKFFTSTVGFTFAVLGTTGVIFKFFFKNHTLTEIHAWLGVAMFAAAIFHIIHNLGPIRKYLRDKRVLALLVPIVSVIVFLSLVEGEEKRDGVNPKQIVEKLAEADLADL